MPPFSAVDDVSINVILDDIDDAPALPTSSKRPRRLEIEPIYTSVVVRSSEGGGGDDGGDDDDDDRHPPLLRQISSNSSSSSSSSSASSSACSSIDGDGDGDGDASALISLKEFPFAPILERSLSFHPFTQIIYIPDVSDYTEDEIQACWYNEKEMEGIRTANRRTIQRIRRGSRRSDDTMRGLESQMHSGVFRSQKIKENSMVAVFSEQYKQRQLSGRADADPDPDADLIRESYSVFTGYATARAADLAREDASESMRIQVESSISISADGNIVRTTKCWLLDPSSWFPRFVKRQDAILDVDSEDEEDYENEEDYEDAV